MIKKMTMTWGMLCLTLVTVFAQTTATPEPIKGSQYVNDQFVEGTIFYANKSMTAPIRYNAFKDLMEYQQNGTALVLDASKNIQRVQLGDETFVVYSYDNKGKQKFGFFAMLDSGEMTLLSKKSITYVAAMKGRALDGSDMPAQYKPGPEVYYYKLGDGTLKEVDNLKALLADLPDNQSSVADFAKKEKISCKKEKDLVALVKHYNSLANVDN
ncbi:MAG TPA: hypothetical protein VK658_17215 [Chryseolinea sp.]|nr:hypothetical protein [Chryseolinea sp.]